MAILTKILDNIGEFALATGKGQGGTSAFAGICAAAKAQAVASVTEKTGRPALVIVPDEGSAARLCEDVSFFLEGNVEVFPYKDVNFFEAQSVSHEIESQRLKVLGSLIRNELKVVVATPDAVMGFLPPMTELEKCTFTVYEGREYDMDVLCKTLSESGYTRTDVVSSEGQFSRRGDLLDVFAPGMEEPVRIEFWGDEVDSISLFDKDTQRRGERINSAVITPARENFCDKELAQVLLDCAEKLSPDDPLKAKLMSDAGKMNDGIPLSYADKYLPMKHSESRITDYADFNIFVSEYYDVKKRAESFYLRLNEDLQALNEKGLMIKNVRYSVSDEELLSSFEKDAFLLEEFPRTSYPFPLEKLINIPCVPLSVWKGSITDLCDRLSEVKKQGSAIILAGTKKAAKTLAGDLSAQGFNAVSEKLPEKLADKTVYVLSGRLSQGVEYPSLSLTVISFARQDEKLRRRRLYSAGEKISSLTDVSYGDAVVHAFHGVGVYEGVNKVEIQGVVKDYIKIRYRDGDTLYVPVTQLDLVSRYIGNEERVKLSKMGGTDWSKAKARVKASVRDMAKELISLYSRRMNKSGYAFSADSEWQRDFESHFEYTETDDQINASQDIKKDMEKPSPMDRLLCGDVGFGKTEVALRAAFKCIADGKQCAILVPTTLLAWQHYQTVMRRMEGFPVKVGLLCRFRSKKQQEETLRDLAAGRIDIAIGTHRLVQKDVKFKSLGLMIIDEEQRFGVAQKEFLKERYDTVDCLSLSATPIPRTLNMALSGIRDMSCIEEAPHGRQPIQSYVTEYDEGVIAEAIRRELRRGGQAYYLHNNTETIDRVAYKLSKLVPEAKVGVAHGKMNETALNDVWEELLDRRIDLLVCTTIIETGVDVPNANTLIIEDADRLGLSQLHQIRGRIGRSYRTAYAYFTFRRGKTVTEIATKRLNAIKEYTEFGSGFKIAMRDLEIRGAGNILGGEQHGHMDSVGYDMYIKLLNEAVSDEMGETKKKETECTVDLPVTAHIPESYISQSQRIDVYRKIAAISNEEDAMEVTDELIDRYGEPPDAVRSLIAVALIRQKAKNLRITDVTERNGTVLFYPEEMEKEYTLPLMSAFNSRLRINAGAKPYYAIKYERNNLLRSADEFLSVMEEIGKKDGENN